MYTHARHRHGHSGEASDLDTKGLVLDRGWRYDLQVWFNDTFVFHGQVRKMRQRTIELARLQPGETALDVGCGTGTLALEVQRRVGTTGRVVGIDPGPAQIARARAKAARRKLSAAFQVGVIEQLAFSDQTFDVAFSTLMIHHLPLPLKRQGFAEIVRVLKPGGRLVIADFKHKADRQGQATHFHAGGSRVQDTVALLKEADFATVETEEMQSQDSSSFPGVGFIRAEKSS